MVIVTPGLTSQGADGATVTLASSVQDTHPRVNLRPPNGSERERLQSFGQEFTTAAALPGHLAPRWAEIGDTIVHTYADGRTVEGKIQAEDPRGWGQVVFT